MVGAVTDSSNVTALSHVGGLRTLLKKLHDYRRGALHYHHTEHSPAMSNLTQPVDV